MTLEDVLAAAEARIRRYTPEEAHTAAAHGARIVDIRSSDARKRHGAVSGGRHVPRTVLEWRVASSEWANPELIGKRLILICEHGLSSVLAASALVDLGVDAGDIVGGFEGWRAAGLPTTGPTRRASGCAIRAGWDADGRLRPARPGSSGHQLHDAAQAPIAPLSAPARRRAPARPAHAPEKTAPWNYSSRCRVSAEEAARAATRPARQRGRPRRP